MIIYIVYILVDENDVEDNGEVIEEETPAKVRMNAKPVRLFKIYVMFFQPRRNAKTESSRTEQVEKHDNNGM